MNTLVREGSRDAEQFGGVGHAEGSRRWWAIGRRGSVAPGVQKSVPRLLGYRRWGERDAVLQPGCAES